MLVSFFPLINREFYFICKRNMCWTRFSGCCCCCLFRWVPFLVCCLIGWFVVCFLLLFCFVFAGWLGRELFCWLVLSKQLQGVRPFAYDYDSGRVRMHAHTRAHSPTFKSRKMWWIISPLRLCYTSTGYQTNVWTAAGYQKEMFDMIYCTHYVAQAMSWHSLEKISPKFRGHAP